MEVFVAVCDAQGFAPAARKLGLSPSVVTRLVAGLEERLGARLLHRTTRSLHLTDAGARYLERVRRILAETEEAEEIGRGEVARPRGRLAITAPVIFGRLHVAPLISRYLARHPEVTADLQLNDRNVALVEEGVDLAVRIGTLSDSSLMIRRVGQTRRVVVASPDYLARRGEPRRPEDIASGAHDTIFFSPLQGARGWRFEAEDGEVRVPLTPRFTTNSGDAALAHACAGGGLTRALLYQVLPLLGARALAVVLEAFEPPPSPIHLVYPSSRLLSAKVRAFIDLAAAEAEWDFTAAPRRGSG